VTNRSATQLKSSWSPLATLARPIEAFRLKYAPLLLLYFAYGALGIIDVSRDMWIKEQLIPSL
jgi:hypothetical protein